MRAIAKVYANLIIKGKKRIEDVPDELKSEVEAILTEIGEEK